MHKVSIAEHAAATEFPMTEAGDAEFLRQQVDGRARWDITRKAWFLFNGQYWPMDTTGEIVCLALESVRQRQYEALTIVDTEARKRASRWAMDGESHRRLQNLIQIASVLDGMKTDGSEWNPKSFDFGVQNGVVDQGTGLWRPGCKHDYITRVSPVVYDPDATCPRWDQFNSEVFGGNTTLASYVHRAIGYSATADMREQAIFIPFGTGANGKSTFLDTIQYVMGDYGFSCAFSTFEAGQRSEIGADVAALAGRRFVTSSETNVKSKFNEARLKAISGGDKLGARHLYGNPFEFSPTCKIWLSVNHKPAVADDSFGFWRRIHLIPFTETFAGSADDKNLRQTLRGEASGILNWILSGCQAWLRDGLEPPAEVLAARDEYQRENDPLADFLEEMTTTAPGVRVSASIVYASYLAWCDQRCVGRERLGRRRFGSLMDLRFEGRHTNVGKAYVGLELGREQ